MQFLLPLEVRGNVLEIPIFSLVKLDKHGHSMVIIYELDITEERIYRHSETIGIMYIYSTNTKTGVHFPVCFLSSAEKASSLYMQWADSLL